MKMDLWYESYIDLNQPQHNAVLRNLVNVLMKSVGEHGEFRIELGGALHYGTYTVTKPGEMVEVRVTPLKKRFAKESEHGAATGRPRQYRRWEILNAPHSVTTEQTTASRSRVVPLDARFATMQAFAKESASRFSRKLRGPTPL